MNQYTEIEMDAMTYKAQADSWRENFEELKVKYEDLQDLFVSTDDELNLYRDKFIDESLQHNYLKDDYYYLAEDLEDLKYRLSVLEERISNIDG
jgi:chromosome segregation ATPase